MVNLRRRAASHSMQINDAIQVVHPPYEVKYVLQNPRTKSCEE
jgi:hypothetical protein